MLQNITKSLFVLIAVFTGCLQISAAENELETTRTKMIAKASEFLRNAQGEDGSFSSQLGIGPSAIAMCGLIESGAKIDDPMIEAGLRYLRQSVREDGGVYTEGGRIKNYETCVVVMCFAAADKAIKESKKDIENPYGDIVKRADKYLREQQYTEDRDVKPEDPFYGGVGYGDKSRPDLSNTHFMLDALKASGAKDDDPAFQKALVFVSRCQNLESEHNTLPFASKNPDGGFIYSSADRSSTAGETADGGLRSYGSMTYAGFKSLIYAGLTKEDKRYKAALEWIQKHYSVDENPGMGTSGLFYYYQTMSSALSVFGNDEFETNAGKKNWKSDLIKKLSSIQQPNGSWVNDSRDRWMEGDPNLVTGYVLMVLSECK